MPIDEVVDRVDELDEDALLLEITTRLTFACELLLEDEDPELRVMSEVAAEVELLANLLYSKAAGELS